MYEPLSKLLREPDLCLYFYTMRKSVGVFADYEGFVGVICLGWVNLGWFGLGFCESSFGEGIG